MHQIQLALQMSQSAYYSFFIQIYLLAMGNVTDVDYGEIHGISLCVSWVFVENAGLWALYFKQKRYAMFIHIACMSLVGFNMAFGPLLMIVQYGPSIITVSIIHEFLGFLGTLIIPFVLLSGALCIAAKVQPQIKPSIVYILTKFHVIFGWAFIFFMKVPLLTGWYGYYDYIFGMIIAQSAISYSLFLYLRFFRKPIEAVSLNRDHSKAELRTIKSEKDLKVYSDNFFIFANYVYSISQVLSIHPGGWKIVRSVRTRQVDRFIYGVDPIELYDVPKVSHTLNSIDLAGEPIAVLRIPSPYQMQELNEATVAQVYCHDDRMAIHTVYLSLKNEKGSFAGYTDIRQIGYYYALTANKKTRLYTAVNFLKYYNISLINRISKSKIIINKNLVQQVNSKYNNKLIKQEQDRSQSMISQTINEQNNQSKRFIPLLIKKYHDGKFTSQFLSADSDNSSILISHPRGLGLALDCVPGHNIVLFAGGTGLYPFSDFIDLLFKAKLVEQSHQLSETILASNSVLKSRPFRNFNVTLYLAVNNLDELHPITLYQCNELSQTSSFKCHAKIKGDSLNTLKSSYQHIGTLEGRFESLVKKHFGEDPTSAFFICGPVRFTRSLVEEMVRSFVPPSHYRIV